MKNNTFQSLVVEDDQRLCEELYLILDSRLQYSEYQANNCLDNFLQPDKNGKAKLVPSQGNLTDTLVDNFERLQHYVRCINRKIKLLLLLQSLLTEKNARAILNLLEDDHFLDYPSETLRQLVSNTTEAT